MQHNSSILVCHSSTRLVQWGESLPVIIQKHISSQPDRRKKVKQRNPEKTTHIVQREC